MPNSAGVTKVSYTAIQRDYGDYAGHFPPSPGTQNDVHATVRVDDTRNFSNPESTSSVLERLRRRGQDAQHKEVDQRGCSERVVGSQRCERPAAGHEYHSYELSAIIVYHSAVPPELRRHELLFSHL